MWRSIASNALTLFIVIGIGIGIAIAMAKNRYETPGPLSEAVCLSIPRGANLKQVTDDLQKMGAVEYPVLMRLGADYTEKAGDLKAGNFLIPPQSSMQTIVDLVTRGGQSTCGSDINLRIGVAASDVQVRELDPTSGTFEVTESFVAGEPVPDAVANLIAQGFARTRVTMAEGVTSWQVADGLSKAPFMSGEIDSVPEEGSLAPGSYEVSIGGDRAELVTRMLQAQEEILAAAWAGRADDLPITSAREALILASIIEKETGVADERPWVSSVFVNRLNQGMRLQTDPSVIYGITKGQGPLGRGLLRSELANPTPFNTYTIPALPPTPIANPGREAIEAAVRPAETDFLFFVADGTGGHVFAKTLAEHNVNVQRWRQIEQQRANQ
ncbi:endolytic transglycosylase MltG [Pseudoruegeria sp. SK021]|uniref:endolytic transglycosylase MltG n=1 Tax=Pseudoruegeria sp. SK021 TaxID=1933035 RepID=UPI000A23634E|nr:endolytic transglycosylase MltG [Pseudoruegeria sp. SK021]OSP53631.1 branched-chain alpha-keto acid dehydrogenase subunit E2 [Pseudoruegeria sp. SK021]